MTIRKADGDTWLYHLIDKGSEDREPFNDWVPIDFLMERYKSYKLPKKTVYDRLRRLALSETSLRYKTVYDCATGKHNQSGVRGSRISGFEPFETKLGVLGL